MPEKKKFDNNATCVPPGIHATQAPSAATPESDDLYTTIKHGTARLEGIKLLIPGFEILEELGRGAFGVVYRARDEQLDRQVAIKVSLLDDPSMREQYVKEAKNAARLECPGIVPVFQVGTLPGGQPFVVQRLIDGSTLRKQLTDAGAIPLHRACSLSAEIARAVAQAHTLGLVHRDLKPDNILIDSAGKPWVADFGLALLEEDQRNHRGEKAGTPLYMSPEQLKGHAEWLDGRTDIYAMGIMLYEMLVGRTPYDANSFAELEEQVLHREAKPISQRSPEIPTEMDIIFQNCCAKQVNDRYANALEMVADLEAVMEEFADTTSGAVSSKKHGGGGGKVTRRSMGGIGVSTRRKTMRSTVRDPVRGPNERRHGIPLAWFAVSTLAVAAIGFTAWWNRGFDGFMLANADRSSILLPQPDSNPKPESPLPKPPLENNDRPKVPARPFRVSKQSDGTHLTIREALAMAEAGEIITILPGNYSESLLIDKNVKLVGEGNLDEIVILGRNEAVFAIGENASMDVTNLTLEGGGTSDGDFNTIELKSGSLALSKCNIYSRSFDCIKVHPGSELKVEECNFRSTAHPAISATKAKSLQISGCNFEIKASIFNPQSKSVGIQANECGGKITRTTFTGFGGAVGVHWKDAVDPVFIEDSIFDNCEYGILLQECQKVTISGSQTSRIVGCKNAILLERCHAEIDGVHIDGAQSNTGIRAVDSVGDQEAVQIQIANSFINGCDVALSIEHSSASAKNIQIGRSGEAGIRAAAESTVEVLSSTITEGEITGINIESSRVRLTDCLVTKNKYAGVLVDGGEQSLESTRCTFENNATGIILISGSAIVRGGEIRANVAGILVASRQQLGQSAIASVLSNPIDINLNGVLIKDQSTVGMLIKTECSFRIKDGQFSDAKNLDRPKIAGDFKLVAEGEKSTVKAVAP